MTRASTEDLRIFLMEVNDEIGSAHPETRDTKISARLLRDILTELLANREAQPVYQMRLLDGSPEQNTWVEVTHEEFNLPLKNPDEWSKRVLSIAPPEASVLAQPVSQGYKLPDNVQEALTLALHAMEFMGDTLNSVDAVCTEDVEYVTPAFTAIRGLLAAAPEGGN